MEIYLNYNSIIWEKVKQQSFKILYKLKVFNLIILLLMFYNFILMVIKFNKSSSVVIISQFLFKP